MFFVLADLEKAETSLPRLSDGNCVIALALKRRLSDRSYYRKQNIRSAKVNKALEKLREINFSYCAVSVDNSWKNISQESDPALWDILTNENAKHDKADRRDEEIEGNDNAVQKEQNKSVFPCPTLSHDSNGTSVSQGKILNKFHSVKTKYLYHSHKNVIGRV